MNSEAAKVILREALNALERGTLTSIICSFNIDDKGVTGISEGNPAEMLLLLGQMDWNIRYSLFSHDAAPDRSEMQ